MGANLTGFIGTRFTCDEKAKIYFSFDEILTDGDVDFKRLNCVNLLTYEADRGSYSIESFEPYTFRYIKILVIEGSCSINGIYLREYVYPDVWGAHFSCGNMDINRLFQAGRETFRQNTLDVFMDCPSRERAGWLCDSFFTSRTAFILSRDTVVEKNFLNNFLLARQVKNIPQAMFPMCYPADHYRGSFIPNWALWFVVQMEEYLMRSGDTETVDRSREKVVELFDYFSKFKNEFGLLERLENWVFIEWSGANQWVQDVNFPTNMLYAAALSIAARLYRIPQFQEDADKISAEIRRLSFDGNFFVDNALRRNGKLEVTSNRSETCQYYAFYFDVATPESHPGLWKTILEKFGPHRNEAKVYPDIVKSNSFIGNMLRMEILSRFNLCSQILDESVSFLLYMAEKNGTLWEHVNVRASLNHGFASHIIHTLYRDILGIYTVSVSERDINIRICDLPLEWCEGSYQLPEGRLFFKWWKDKEKISYHLENPAGYRVTIENLSGKEIARYPAAGRT